MTRPAPLRVVLVIAAVYTYFLIFAEFAFLELAQAGGGGPRLQGVMAVLGAGGIAGSLLAAWRFDPARYGPALAAGFGGGALGALLAMAVPAEMMAAVAAVVGLSLGWLTVTLAAGLRALIAPGRLGLGIGAGTGLAYAACNLPWVFAAPPVWQAAGAVFVAGGGAALSCRWRGPVGTVEPGPDYTWGSRVAWLVLLLVLVWLDSAAFYIIQHTPELRAVTWGGGWTLAGNALTHLLAALVAGWLLDRGAQARLVAAAFGLLLAACWLLGHGARELVGVEVPYTMAVSVYSTVLVFYPARSGRPWLVAAVYAVAGWVGSALGVGMAQDLHRVPDWFLVASGSVFIVAGLARSRGWRRAAGLGLAALLPGWWSGMAADPIARGREIYVSEGCIHCHSQYVRPGTADTESWGPAVPLAETLAAAPPLLGNRRQGPDLATVGSRRSPEWNRLHLIAPRAVSPGSRMPAYAHLFRGEDAPGEALVAYLASLGADRMPAVRAQQAQWRPAAVAVAPAAEQRRQFLRLCAPCHGPEGRGDGPLAAQLGSPPPDFTRGGWRRVRGDDPDLPLALARLIKFGLPATAMAGHEYLDDATVVSLAQYVQALHRDAHP